MHQHKKWHPMICSPLSPAFTNRCLCAMTRIGGRRNLIIAIRDQSAGETNHTARRTSHEGVDREYCTKRVHTPRRSRPRDLKRRCVSDARIAGGLGRRRAKAPLCKGCRSRQDRDKRDQQIRPLPSRRSSRSIKMARGGCFLPVACRLTRADMRAAIVSF